MRHKKTRALCKVACLKKLRKTAKIISCVSLFKNQPFKELKFFCVAFSGPRRSICFAIRLGTLRHNIFRAPSLLLTLQLLDWIGLGDDSVKIIWNEKQGGKVEMGLTLHLQTFEGFLIDTKMKADTKLTDKIRNFEKNTFY